MLFKRFKKIVAQVLLLTILIPNLNVNAIVNDLNSGDIKENIQISDNIDKNQLLEEGQDEVTDITNSDEDTDITVNTEKVEESVENIVENKDETIVEDKDETIVEDVEETVKLEEDKKALEGEKYTTKVAPIVYKRTMDEKANELEFQLKMEGASTLSLLETKTDSSYEIALAHSDGSYSFVKEAEDLETAVEEANALPVAYSDEDVIPAVVARNGQIVYAQNSMARIWKHIDGKPYMASDKNTNVYSDPALNNAFTYVNHSYVDDVPVIADNGNSAKVLISGYEGWVNKNTSAAEYDLVIVPINQAVNPSYYYVENGELKHFISSNLTGVGGHSISIGKAPEYLTQGVKYLSYDGVYFYDGSNISNGLNNLMNDYKSGSRGSAVNAGNPHYTYYKYLPFRSKTVYSGHDLDRFIDENTQQGSKLRGMGGALKDAEQKYGVNALLTLGVAMNESAWGMSSISQSKNNLFGIKAYDSNVNGASEFANPAESIYEFAKNYISRGYADPTDWRYFGGFLGSKKHGANIKYASDPFWSEKAAQHAFTVDKYLSGSVNNLRDTDSNQIAMTTSNNTVMKSDGSVLYNIGNIEIPFVVSKKGRVTVGGQNTYEIYPERNTAVSTGKFEGIYDWYEKGYILDMNIKFLNKAKDMTIKQPYVEVAAGIDRYATAVELSKSNFTKSGTVVLVNGLALVDGLTATPLATYHDAPILLTEKNTIPKVTIEELKRLGTEYVVIVGGTNVISGNIEQQLKNIGINSIARVQGIDRYETSLEVAKYIDAYLYDVGEIVVASGFGEADAMSIAPVAGRDRLPIILTKKNEVPSNIYNWLKSEDLFNAYVIGGTTVIGDSVLRQINGIVSKDITWNRIGGANRSETNALVINRFYGNIDTVYITKELTLVDALSAGPIAALNGSPIVLSGYDLNGEQKDVLSQRTANRIVQAGHGVSAKAVDTLKKCLEIVEY